MQKVSFCHTCTYHSSLTATSAAAKEAKEAPPYEPLVAKVAILLADGALAILVATINIAGGFLVTQRMLQMFRK